MGYGLEEIRNTLARISQGDTLLEMLMEFERTLDSVEIFAYENWTKGELVKGPEISRYWFTTWWMYPEKYMPNPDGALRLEKIGCKVTYKKDVLKHPKRVLSPTDVKTQKSRRAEIVESPVWIVKIKMPMRYISDNLETIETAIDDEILRQDKELAKEFTPQQEENELDMEMGMEENE